MVQKVGKTNTVPLYRPTQYYYLISKFKFVFDKPTVHCMFAGATGFRVRVKHVVRRSPHTTAAGNGDADAVVYM
jgi:hypothetical protein